MGLGRNNWKWFTGNWKHWKKPCWFFIYWPHAHLHSLASGWLGIKILIWAGHYLKISWMFGCKRDLEEMKTLFSPPGSPGAIIFHYHGVPFPFSLCPSFFPPYIHAYISIEIPHSCFSPQSQNSENIPAIFRSNLTKYLLFMSQGYFALQVPSVVMDAALKESLTERPMSSSPTDIF